MDPNDHADALSLLADAALSDEPHEATWDAPRGLDMRTANALEDAAPASTGAASPPASPGDAANREEGVAFGRAPRSSSPVTIDSERATVVPVGTYYAQVIEECLERLAMLARHRDERPSRARREIEARILAQVDAIVEARATVGDLIAFWDREVDDDPWSAWAVTFTLGCLEGREPVAAIRDLCEALPDDGARAALVVVDALVASPHGARGVLGRELVRSSSPLARAVGIELLSRMGQLAHEIELAALDQEHPEVQAAGVRAVTRRETAGAAMAGLRAGLHSEHACVVREAARALALFGQDDGLEELRGGDQLANMLGEGALEPFVLRGDLDDIGVMQRIARWLPASAGSLSAVGRFGHPAAWAYLRLSTTYQHGIADGRLTRTV
jgi:hypothetical protein